MESQKQTKMPSGRLFIESEKLAQAVDEFARQLKVCAKAWGDTTNIHSKCRCTVLCFLIHSVAVVVGVYFMP